MMNMFFHNRMTLSFFQTIEIAFLRKKVDPPCFEKECSIMIIKNVILPYTLNIVGQRLE